MPRVPDARAGWCSRLGGGGAPVNKCQHCQKRLSVLVLVVGQLGDTLRQEIQYLGRNRIWYTHLGCFGAPAGAGAGGRANDNAFQKSVIPN